ncbi:TonB-dependent receptor [Nemorincola caseinilytica]|uniref:TonB-dependent receptor n=2 Tax=Nemorincola caseinilytica TaxID=2054315 RepID=A0ABP8NRB4_9BACT
MAMFIMFVGDAQRCTAQSCNFRISGVVTDDQRHPLIGAIIRLETDSAKGDVTDTGGRFSIHRVCPGHTLLTCRADGFSTGVAHMHITGNSTIRFSLNADKNQLAEVVVNGVRLQDIHSLSQVELRGLERFQASGKTLGDAIKALPGLNAIQTGPTISKPMIHGLHSSRVLILNNGIRQEGQQWGSEHAPEIDPFVANRISVVKGAASVRYGADAIGGVVLLEPDPLPVAKGMSGNVYLIGQSNGRMGTASATVQGRTGEHGIAWRVQGTAKQGGNFSTPHYYLKNTAMREQNFSAQAGYKYKGLDVAAYYSMYHTRNGIFEGSHAGNITDLYAAIARERPVTASVFSYDIARSYQDIRHELAKVGATYHFANEGKLEMNAARQDDIRQEYDVSLPYTKDPTLLSKPQVSFQLMTHSAELVYTTPSRNGLSGNMGMAGNTQGNVFKGIRYLVPNFRTYSGGVFAIERYNTGKLTFEAGARYDHRWQRVYQRNASTLQTYHTTLTFSNPTGTVGAIYRATDKLSFTANAGTAWRAPSVNELYIHGVHFSDASYQDGDSTLKAERSLNTGITVAYNSKKLRATADVYRNHIGNYIYETPQLQPVTLLSGTFPAFRFTQDNVTISGVDASLQYDFARHFTLQSRATIVRGYNNTADAWLIYMPADRYENGIVFNLHELRFMEEPYISVENVSTLRQTRVPQGLDYAAPPAGYSIFNASAGFTTHIRKKKMMVDVTVANMTNTRYRDYLDKFRYYADNIGINFIVKTRFSF